MTAAGPVDFHGNAPRVRATVSLHAAAQGHPAPNMPVVDAAVHPRTRPGELHGYLPRVWRERRLPAGDRYYYPNPAGDYLIESFSESGPPGSDPELTSQHLFTDLGIDQAILVPLTLGLLPDTDLAAAIASAINTWLAEQWLERYPDRRYHGTIRVVPSHPEAAVAEIERWAGHPGFVQVGVPMQSMQLYGNPMFLPVWRAAAEHGLPVAFHPDAETGVELAPTPAGYLRHFLGFAAYQPITFISHLTNMIVNGVLDTLPDLRLVFADGGYDVCAPLMWRLDKDYRPMRPDMPWLERPPSSYLEEQVRFVAQRMEGPEEPALLPEWLDMTSAATVLMYGSNYPNWDLLHSNVAFRGAGRGIRERILAGNAAALYPLGRVGASE